MTRRLAVCVTWLAAAVLTANARADDKVALKAKYVPGDYVQTVSTVTAAKGDLGVVAVVNKTELTIDIAMTIAPPDDQGHKKATYQFRRIRMSTELGGRKVSYDSSQPAGDDPTSQNLAKIYGPLTKTKIAVVIGADEKVKEVSGLDKMWDDLAKTDPGLAAAKQSLGDESVKKKVEQAFASLPDRPVGVGDEWVVATPLDLPPLGKTELKSTHRLKAFEVGGKVAVIDFTGRLASPKPPDPAAKPPDNQMTTQIDGTMKVNVDNPLLTEFTSTTKTITTSGEAINTNTTTTTSSTILTAAKEVESPKHIRPSPWQTPPPAEK
jgi:hypothetical protein